MSNITDNFDFNSIDIAEIIKANIELLDSNHYSLQECTYLNDPTHGNSYDSDGLLQCTLDQNLEQNEIEVQNENTSDSYEFSTMHIDKLEMHLENHMLTDDSYQEDASISYESGPQFELNDIMTGHKYSCNLCLYEGATQFELDKHILKHTVEKTFDCGYCDYKATQSNNLKRHMAKHVGEKCFPCNYCDYRAINMKQLTLHKTMHATDRYFVCNICDYKTSRKVFLKKHVKMKHTVDDKGYKCHLCDFGTGDIRQLKAHLVAHMSNTSFNCEYCDFKTVNKRSLTLHIAKHIGKYFSCTMCSYKGAYAHHLKRHMLTHNVEKSFQCSLCSYKTVHRYNLKRHMPMHDPQKGFKCHLCSYRAASKIDLKQHKETHIVQQVN